MSEKNLHIKRVLRVYYTYIKDHEVPLIRLEGRWLYDLGFTTDSHIQVEGKTGELMIKTRADDHASGRPAPWAENFSKYPHRHFCHGLSLRCRHCRRQLCFSGGIPEYLL